jgi:ParB-like chromosome segregation protein Spo0J
MTKPALRAHPIAELVPSMTADHYSALVQDIREQGLRTPIVMYEGMVLDGRHRARAWYDLHGNWDVPSTEFNGTAEQAIAFVRSHNIKRRHLKPSQIAYYEAQAAAFWNPQQGRPKINSHKSPTQRQIAKEAGVDIETIALAAKAVKVAPEVGPYLRDGKISVNRALPNCRKESASMRSPSRRSARRRHPSRGRRRIGSSVPMPMAGARQLRRAPAWPRTMAATDWLRRCAR